MSLGPDVTVSHPKSRSANNADLPTSGIFVSEAATVAFQMVSKIGTEGRAGTPEFQNLSQDLLDIVLRALQGLIALTKKLVNAVLLLTALIVSSLLTYALVYIIVMPMHRIRKPIHFDYNFHEGKHQSGPFGHYIASLSPRVCTDDGVGLKLCSEEQRTFLEEKEHQNHQKRRSAIFKAVEKGLNPPTGIVDLSTIHTQWMPVVNDVVPKVPSHTSAVDRLDSGRHYYLDIALTLPESDANRHIGMFVLEIDLLSNDGAVLASSTRSTMLPYESYFVGMARKFLLLFPILIGATPEARTVTLSCFDHFVESSNQPLASLVVRLITPKSWSKPKKGNHFVEQVQLLGAEIRIGKELNAMQRTMKDWFFTCGLVGTLFMMIIYGTAFLIMHTFYNSFKIQRRHNSEWQSNTSHFWPDDKKRSDVDLGYEYESDLGDGGSYFVDCHESGCTDGESNDNSGSNEWKDIVEDKDRSDNAGEGTDRGTSEVYNNNWTIDKKRASEAVGCESGGKDEPKRKRKEKKISANKAEMRSRVKSCELQDTKERHREQEEAKLARRVLKGDINPYEIFTGM